RLQLTERFIIAMRQDKKASVDFLDENLTKTKRNSFEQCFSEHFSQRKRQQTGSAVRRGMHIDWTRLLNPSSSRSDMSEGPLYMPLLRSWALLRDGHIYKHVAPSGALRFWRGF